MTSPLPLNGLKALITAGPTHEPIDPVRFIGNRSSGKQGYAIAAALTAAGANVTLISGPVKLDDPKGIKRINVQTATEMLAACETALQDSTPTDIAICAAAVGDWSPTSSSTEKIKKQDGQDTLQITLKKNPDILHTISNHTNRPRLVIGFAAETCDLIENAQAKLSKKGCDIIVANSVANGKTFGADENHVYLLNNTGATEWPPMSKQDIATKLVETIIDHL